MSIENTEFTVHLHGHGYDHVWPDASIRVDDKEHVYRLVKGKQSFTFESQLNILQGHKTGIVTNHTLSVVWSNFRPSLVANGNKMLLEILGIDVEGSPILFFKSKSVEKFIEIHCDNHQTTGTHLSNNGTWLINFTTPFPFYSNICIEN
tara:strand:+ start:121 stop:567 length:447 start_codon:yes stop_codon:yes gene_type:complete